MSVTALDVRLRFSPEAEHRVGRLAVTGRDVVFQYDDAFVAKGLQISPMRLPLRHGVQVFDRAGGLDLFGVFEDSMTDSWGRRIVDRHFQKTLRRTPTALERLAFVGERGMGALTFHPPTEPAEEPGKELDLVKLAVQAWDFDDEKLEEALTELRRVAGTSGGARPKALVGLPKDRKASLLPGDTDLPAGYQHWIVKFNSRADIKDAGVLEYAYAKIAEAAGGDVPECRLIETKKGRFFASRRFDRPAPAERMHLHSVAGMLHANYRVAGTEYLDLFKLTDGLTRDYAQKQELFRRACLNVMACNRDDHLKNFALMMGRDGTWRLSPLFDFTFHTGPNGWHTLNVAGEGENPTREHLLRLANDANLRERDAKAILTAVADAVSRFDKLAKKLKISKRTADQVISRLRLLRTQ
ncbi:MAG TPA: type II toxin-antitoxin system HipA family toxin [Planctomycetota bacterium]|nr:type II toxin-antitoxin system HipA family toxin [Planctomycetota bacterium]